MNKLFINSSVIALSVFASIGYANASFLSDDSITDTSKMVVPFYNPFQDVNFEVKATAYNQSSKPFSWTPMKEIESSSHTSSGFKFSDEALEEVFSKPSVKKELKLDEETNLAVIHIQELIDTDQDLGLLLSIRAARSLFTNPEIFETFFSHVISNAITRNGFFSLQTTHLLEQLNEDQKAKVLAPYGYKKLFKAPVAPRRVRVKATLVDGFNKVRSNVFGVKKTITKKRDHDEMAPAENFFDDLEMKKETISKRRKKSEDFDTRQEELTYITTALKGHVEEVFQSMPSFYVSDRQALNSLVEATGFMGVPSVAMIGHYTSPSEIFQWGESDVSKLSSALKNKRIQKLDLGSNLITTGLVRAMNWNGLISLDLSGNLIRNFGQLLQSEIKHLRLNSNGIKRIQEEEVPLQPNTALSSLDVSLNLFESEGMISFLKTISLFPNLDVLNIGTSSKKFLSTSTILEGLDVTHPSLRVLGLSGWSLDKSAISYVLQLPKLEVLDLSAVSFGKDALIPLHDQPSSLKKVVVSSYMSRQQDHMKEVAKIQKKGIEVIPNN
jgi:hypothetical protein